VSDTSAIRRLQAWFQSRYGRQPYAIWSPLDPPELLKLLEKNLKPWGFFVNGRIGRIALVDGSPPTWSLILTSRYVWARSSTFYTFKGFIGAGDRGSWIKGDVGPDDAVFILNAVDAIAVAILSAFATIALVTNIIARHQIVHLRLLADCFYPIAIFTCLLGSVQLFTRKVWTSTDRWLRALATGQVNPD